MSFLLGRLHKGWKAYNALLLTRPIATKTITAVAIGALGDITCQLLERRQRKLLALVEEIKEAEEEQQGAGREGAKAQHIRRMPARREAIEETLDFKRTARFATWIAMVTVSYVICLLTSDGSCAATPADERFSLIRPAAYRPPLVFVPHPPLSRQCSQEDGR
jgi:hypothetical protein